MDPIQFYYPEFISKKQEYNQVYTLRFTKPPDLSFTAGQWVHLGMNTSTPDKSMVRHMSFSSAPSDNFLEFSMDLGSGSNYKNAMASLQVGEQVKAFKIRGEFTMVPDEKRELIFLCGGIGITPVRSLIRQMQTTRLHPTWTLVHVARNEFLYQDELKTYNGKQIRVNRPELETVWPFLLEDSRNKLFYICGSSRFLDGMISLLTSNGINENHIKTESFK